MHSNNGVRTTEIYLKATDTRDTANDSERRSARTPESWRNWYQCTSASRATDRVYPSRSAWRNWYQM